MANKKIKRTKLLLEIPETLKKEVEKETVAGGYRSRMHCLESLIVKGLELGEIRKQEALASNGKGKE